MENKLPQRKNPRLKRFDYSSAGVYFVTICIKDRKYVLSDILSPVGDGALDVPSNGILNPPMDDADIVPEVRLTRFGKIIEKYLLSSENIPGVKIDRYVIMPDHIHVMIVLDPSKYQESPKKTDAPKGGTSRAPSPTNEMLPHVVSTFKRLCNREIGISIFQRTYIEHIVRDWKDYETRVNYIHKNPIRWYYRNKNK